MQAAIYCEGLTKRYGRGTKAVDAVNGLDLTVRAGECFGLLGPNGAGKTTTVEIFEGLLQPTSGRVELFGLAWHRRHDDKIRQRIGITLQDSRFHDKLSCLEILTLFRSFYRTGLEPAAALDLVSLEEKAGAWVRNLSGGQRQRLAVAVALVGDPDLVFLDEPTTGLDPQARRQFWEVIGELKSRGRTVLLTTHYMDEAERLCDRVAVVDHGKIIALDSPRGLISNLAGENVLEFSIDSGVSETAPCPADFEELDEIAHCQADAEGFSVRAAHAHIAIPALLQRLNDRGWKLNRLTTRHANLEDVFVNLTGRHLRDE